jgi:hypothetical protein
VDRKRRYRDDDYECQNANRSRGLGFVFRTASCREQCKGDISRASRGNLQLLPSRVEAGDALRRYSAIFVARSATHSELAAQHRKTAEGAYGLGAEAHDANETCGIRRRSKAADPSRRRPDKSMTIRGMSGPTVRVSWSLAKRPTTRLRPALIAIRRRPTASSTTLTK